MLIVEIAAGVFLGLLAYRSVDKFCKSNKCTIPEAIGLLLWKARLLALICFLALIAILLVPYLPPLENFIVSLENHHPGFKFVGIDKDGHDLIKRVRDLPSDPPGYFYVRSQRITDMNNLPVLLRGAQCVADCDSDNSLWLVPRTKQ
jgi:hypothetical protein